MGNKFIDFAAVKKAVSFADAIEALDLKMKFAGNQWRSQCPICEGDERSLVITADKGWFCHVADQGGDVIGLAKHILDLSSMRDAAFELSERAARNTGTSKYRTRAVQVPESDRESVSRRPRGGGTQKPPPQPTRAASFDPESFWAKTAYTDEVADLGITEDQAEALGIGFYRGKLYQALRYANGQIAGFSAFANGELKLPSNLLPMSNVVALKRA